MFKRIDHIELVTADPQRAERFYTEVLGFTVRERVSVPGGLALTYLDLGGTTVELMCYGETKVEPAPQAEHLGYRMMALEVDDMQQALAYLEGKGIEPVWGPITRPAYARAEIRDPDGNHIELRQWISGSGSRRMRVAVRFAAVIAALFGVATVVSGADVLFGGGAAAAGDYVPLVVWFNFLAGFLYVAAGVGLWRGRRWAAQLSLLLALATAAVFAALGVHIATGGAFEARTVAAMALRTLVWTAIALLARSAERTP